MHSCNFLNILCQCNFCLGSTILLHMQRCYDQIHNIRIVVEPSLKNPSLLVCRSYLLHALTLLLPSLQPIWFKKYKKKIISDAVSVNLMLSVDPTQPHSFTYFKYITFYGYKNRTYLKKNHKILCPETNIDFLVRKLNFLT